MFLSTTSGVAWGAATGAATGALVNDWLAALSLISSTVPALPWSCPSCASCFTAGGVVTASVVAAAAATTFFSFLQNLQCLVKLERKVLELNFSLFIYF